MSFIAEIAQDFQGNILKAHRKDFSAYLFFTWKNHNKNTEKIRVWLSNIAHFISTHAKQMGDTEDDNIVPFPGMFFSLGLTHVGYYHIDRREDSPFSVEDKTFSQALSYESVPTDQRRRALGEEHSAMAILAHSDPDVLSEILKWFRQKLKDSDLLDEEEFDVLKGRRVYETFFNYTPPRKSDINTLGYLEGASEIRDLTEKFEATRLKPPGFDSESAFGSIMTFIRFETNSTVFKTTVYKLAERMFGNGPNEENKKFIRGALMGRHQDGEPLAAYGNSTAPLVHPPNEFDFSSDPDGKRCPFAAHIRVVNKREKTDAEDAPLKIVRRGMNFVAENDEKGKEGLYFMSYQSSINEQLAPLYVAMKEMQDTIIYKPNEENKVRGGSLIARPTSIFHPTGEGKQIKVEGDDINFVEYTGEAQLFFPPVSYFNQFAEQPSV